MKLEIKGLQKKFGETQVLHNISFQIESGKALGLLGRNGAGKTTTIRIIMNLFEANEGNIFIDGKAFDPRAFQIGYLPEERGLYPKKKVIEQLIFLGELRGLAHKKAKENALKWLERLGVMQYKDKKLETLSKGNQQKVQLASTFLCDPEIVILDEPFSGLDPVNSQVLKEIIIEFIESKKLVIFSSHQMAYVEEFCEEIAIIDKGNIVLTGNLRQIKKEMGKNRLLLSVNDMSAVELKAFIEQEFHESLHHLEPRKKDLLIDLKGKATKNQFLNELTHKNLDIELFSEYHPTLSDIFIEKVGDES